MSILKNKFIIYFIFYLTFILSFIFGENSSGGSSWDSSVMQSYEDQLRESIQNGIMFFIETKMVHTPTFYIIKSILENFLNKFSSDLIFLTLSFFIPIIFYSILKKQFRGLDRNILFAISLVLYLSPYIRSSAVWATNDNLGILFFTLSLSKFLTYTEKKNNNYKDIYLSFFYLILAIYIRQYYAIITILYLALLFKKINIKNFFYIIFFNLSLLTPLILYTNFYFQINSEYALGLKASGKGFITPNLIFNSLVFFTMYLFYILPFFSLSKNYIRIKNIFFNKKILFLIITIFFIIIFFNYELSQNQYGGGIIFKISQLIDSKLFFVFLSYIGAISILLTINFDFKNLLILISIFLMFPFSTIFQKYYDPFMIIIFFGLIRSNLMFENINLKKVNLIFIFTYFLFFLISANIYYFKIT
tara:strand:- start:46 stop:1299 length:1254 start_codon:yes stop_codon:yes gene_type:complete